MGSIYGINILRLRPCRRPPWLLVAGYLVVGLLVDLLVDCYPTSTECFIWQTVLIKILSLVLWWSYVLFLFICRCPGTFFWFLGLHFSILRLEFCTLGHHVVDLGFQWDTKGNSLGSRVGLSLIFNGFGGPVGSRIWSVRCFFLGTRLSVLSVSSEVCFLMALSEKMMPGSVVGCVKNIANTVVFVRFHFFTYLMNWLISNRLLSVFLVGFWVPWAHFLWFLRVWGVGVEIDDFPWVPWKDPGWDNTVRWGWKGDRWA